MRTATPREDYSKPLSAAERETASALWSARVSELVRESDAGRRLSVTVDLDDDFLANCEDA